MAKQAKQRFTNIASVKAAQAWARDVEGIYAEETQDQASARAFLRKKGYLTASGKLTAQYSR